MCDFTLDFNDDLYNSKIFGVYRGHVTLPDSQTCLKGDKPFDRFFYVVNGTIRLQTENSEITGKSREIIFLPNDVTYKSEWIGSDDGDYISVNFTLNRNIIFPKRICIVEKDDTGEYYKMFENMLSVWLNGATGFKFAMLSELYRLLYILFLSSTKRRLKENFSEIHKGILYLENHMRQDISVGELAQRCGMSETNFRRLFKKYKRIPPVTYRNYLRINKAKDLLLSPEHFCRVFKAHTGFRPMEYVNLLKLHNARELLRHSRLSISEIAEKTGFESHSYFSMLFKRHIGVTPSEYRGGGN